MQITKSLFPVGGVYTTVKKLNESLQKLQVQLATQQKASNLSELGSNRVFDLTLRSRLSRLDAFTANIDTTNLRLDFLDNSVSRLNEIEADTRGDLSSSGIGSNGIYIASASETAYNRLDEILTILNGDLNGRHMFGGDMTDARPVVSADVLLNGDSTHAGLKQIIAERKLADFGGPTGHGRLAINQIQLSVAAGATNEAVISESAIANGPVIANVDVSGISNVTATPAAGPPATNTVAFTGLPADGETLTVTVQQPDGTNQNVTFTAVAGTPANPGEFQIGADADATAANFRTAFGTAFHGNSVTIAEDGAHPFGIKLNSATTNSSDISIVSQTTTQPHVLALKVNSLPQNGEKVSLNYTLPDGATGSFDVVATTVNPPPRGQFLIGADADATAANLQAALTTQLDYVRDTSLTAASADLATQGIITAKGETAMRVVDPGTGFANATTIAAADPATTIIWYTGEDSPGSARQTATARVDESTTIYYGVQANEQGIATLLRSNALMAAETFNVNDNGGAERYQQTAQRQVQHLAAANTAANGSLDVIALELGLSRATAGSASERHKTYGAQLDTMLSDIESVDINEVAMQLLAAKTNLEASYQTMASLSQLSLVNFLP